MDLQLIEQACGCSTVSGGGGLKVRCSPLPAGILMESACHQARAGGFTFATRAVMDLRLIEQVCVGSTVRGEGRLKVLVFAAGTLMESACHQAPASGFAFATEAAMDL